MLSNCKFDRTNHHLCDKKKEAIILFVRNTHPCPIYFYHIPPKSFDDVCFIPIFVMSNKMKESKKQLLLTL